MEMVAFKIKKKKRYNNGVLLVVLGHKDIEVL